MAEKVLGVDASGDGSEDDEIGGGKGRSDEDDEVEGSKGKGVATIRLTNDKASFALDEDTIKGIEAAKSSNASGGKNESGSGREKEKLG